MEDGDVEGEEEEREWRDRDRGGRRHQGGMVWFCRDSLSSATSRNPTMGH